MRVCLLAALTVALLAPRSAFAVPPSPPIERTPAEQAAHDEKMTWWRDARFGMFIHWGVYAVPAGTHDGERVKGIGEWIMRRAEIPVAEYKKYAEGFTAENYDPEAWAALAKRAGMKYVIITAKHHDGFALFDSAVTDWDAADASPAGRDLIGPLVEAVKDEGLKMGLYYSQDQDWTHPGGSKRRVEEGGGWDEAHKGSFDDYLTEIAVPQVREILTRYPIDVLWWDTPTWITLERTAPFAAILENYPTLITNNRLIAGVAELAGDTDTPEQQIPATGFPGRDFEVCMTMNDTWGYKSYDDNWKSTEDLIRKLCDIASKGGNFLLNIGPKADGTIPPESVERLEAIGRWMDINGEAIYGTSASPFRLMPWGRCTRKDVGDGVTRLYLHVFEKPADGRIVVPVVNEPRAAASLADAGVTFPVETSGAGLVIDVSSAGPFDEVCTVLTLDVEGEAAALDTRLRAVDGVLSCPPELADIHNKGYGRGQIRVEERDGEKALVNWLDHRAYVEWPVAIDGPVEVVLTLDVQADAEATLNVSFGDAKTEVAIPAGEGFTVVESDPFSIGSLDDDAMLTLKPKRAGWNPVEIRGVSIRPVD